MLTSAFRGSFICRSCKASLFKARRTAAATPPQRHAHHESFKSKSKILLPSGPARTRFAPSPTGYLHLGSLRTALFNYLLAKRTGGQFLLRIEDTDKKRTIADAEQRLFDDLRWAGLQWDEGPEAGGPYGPYRQSERTELYQEHAHKLVESGHAYRCFCSTERLNELAARRAKIGLPTDYDRTCASIPKEESDDRSSKGDAHVIRLRSPDVYPRFVDLVYGKVGKDMVKSNRHLEYSFDDPILLKSDGLPTYHLANVVDDHLMKITHVVRGTEWMIATPKHLAMYEAFGWTPPQFAHVGLLQDESGGKLSKRRADVDIASFRERGILPEALVNFVALLGWSRPENHQSRSDLMQLKQLEGNFDMRWTKGNVTVNLGKLDWMQKHHAMARVKHGGPRLDDLIDAVVNEVKESRFHRLKFTSHPPLYENMDDQQLHSYVSRVLQADAKNYTNPGAFAKSTFAFFHDFDPSYKWAMELLSAAPTGTLDVLKQLLYDLEELPTAEWKKYDAVKAIIDESVGELMQKIKYPGSDYSVSTEDEGAGEEEGDEQVLSKDQKIQASRTVYSCLRAALTDALHGAPVPDAMVILGKDKCLERWRAWLALSEEGRPGLDFSME